MSGVSRKLTLVYKRGIVGRFLFRLVRLPIPWVFRFFISRLMAFLKSPLGNRFFSFPNKQLIERGQYISNVKELLGIQSDEISSFIKTLLSLLCALSGKSESQITSTACHVLQTFHLLGFQKKWSRKSER